MRVEIAAMAERVDVHEDGAMTLHRVFDTVTADEFPFTIGPHEVVFRVVLSPDDEKRPQHGVLRLIGEDLEKGYVERDAIVAFRESPNLLPVAVVRVKVDGATIHAPGTLAWVLELDSEIAASMMFAVVGPA